MTSEQRMDQLEKGKELARWVRPVMAWSMLATAKAKATRFNLGCMETQTNDN